MTDFLKASRKFKVWLLKEDPINHPELRDLRLNLLNHILNGDKLMPNYFADLKRIKREIKLQAEAMPQT